MKYNKFLPYIVFPAFLIMLLMPLLTGRYYPKWDASDYGYPAFAYMGDSIREGRFPLWDPYTNCGMPYHADPISFAYNPLAILIGFTLNNAATGFVFLWIVYWCWAGLGMIWLSKNFGATPSGAFLAAIAFSLSGFFIGHAEHTSFILTAAWFPWIIGLAHKAVKESSIGYALLAGAAGGFCCLGGYPGLIAVFGFALLLWLALRYISIGFDSSDKPLKRLLWIFITLGVIGIVMLAVWSPVLNAFFTEGKGYTERVSQLDPHLANFGHPFPLAASVSLFFPFATLIFPSLVNADYSMTNGYVGLLTIPFAALWLIKGREGAGDGRRRMWWLFVFALFMFILSLGGQADLRTIALYYIYPPIRFMRFSAPFRVFWMLPLSLAAGLGFSYLQKHPEDRALMFRIFVGWVAAGLCVGIAVAVACASDKISTSEVFPDLYLPAIIIAVFGGRFSGTGQENGRAFFSGLLRCLYWRSPQPICPCTCTITPLRFSQKTM